MLGKKVGILGGGQLGRMLALAAQPMGIHVAILDPLGAHSPAGMVSHVAHPGDFKNAEQILEFVEKVRPDVLTVEIEHVNVVALETVQKAKGIVIQPSPSTIRVIQDKFLQKIHLRNHGVQLPDFQAAEGKGEIEEVGKKFGYPLMLKSRKLAYDGRGNAVVKNPDEIEKALGSLVSNEVYIEKWVHFQKELAVIVVRGIDGTVISYPTVETIQKDSMCDKVIAPAQIHPSAAAEARRLAEKAVATLEGAGVFGVELFLLDDGSVLLNEIAPRVHNSGHFTIEASETSQFENHVRAVLGLPLGSTAMRVGAAMMVNVIGNGNQEETFAPCIRALSVAGASVHWYSKGEAKKARKMGHITIVGGDFAQVLERFKSVTLEEEGPRPLPVVGVIMGSDSDLPIMKPAAVTLREFGVPFELTVVSAHRTPERMMEYAKNAHLRGLKVIIAAAGGAAHLPGMVAAITPLPVIGVPRALSYLDGQDSLYSIVQMPSGVPVATVAINNSTNAALLAIRILGGPYTFKMAEYQRHLELQVIQKVERLEEEGWEKYGAKKE